MTVQNTARKTNLLIGVALAAIATALAWAPIAVEAGSREAVVPVGGHWCGLTDLGGPIHMHVTSDGRWVEGISLAGASSSEGGSGVGSIQITESKFIFRSRSSTSSSRGSGPISGPICRSAPCSKGGGGTVVVQESMIRGTFTSPTSMRGNFSLVEERRRILGQYSAWPAEFAPCP